MAWIQILTNMAWIRIPTYMAWIRILTNMAWIWTQVADSFLVNIKKYSVGFKQDSDPLGWSGMAVYFMGALKFHFKTFSKALERKKGKKGGKRGTEGSKRDTHRKQKLTIFHQVKEVFFRGRFRFLFCETFWIHFSPWHICWLVVVISLPNIFICLRFFLFLTIYSYSVH